MTDILGKEIVGYKEACYLKEMGYDEECTGYYHIADDDEEICDESYLYECVGWTGLFRNSYSIFRAAAPLVKDAQKWYKTNQINQFM